MNKQNIERLAARLEALGCEPSIKHRLAAYACFAPAQFEIRHYTILTDGAIEFFVHCVKADQGLYDAVSYTAVLKRKSTVALGMEALDEAMGRIDWERLYAARETVTEIGYDEAVNAADTLKQLHEVDSSGLLRFRHWAGTTLENLIPNVAVLKSQYELSQRFYLLPDQPPIRFDEAQRFLQSRWMEKKINADRKLLVKNGSAAPMETGAKGGKLLTKRTKANRKPGLFNR
ncbi:MAG: hypothetical protein V4539_16185 [Bacteroidota bacterium]